MATQISQFFGRYPSIDSPDFNHELSIKEEFSELSSESKEKLPEHGKLFSHQEFTIRYLYRYKRLAVMHSAGTGKSIIIAASAELFKEEYLKNPNDPTKIKRAYVLVKNAVLKENIKNEIVCKGTNRIYETEAVLGSTTQKQLKTNISNELKQWYEILTYHEFSRLILDFHREQDLENFMSNIAIYVDEAHNVASTKDINAQQRPIVNINQLDQYPEETKYDTIFRAFHKGKRNVIAIFSASPMTNKSKDLRPFMNLILPENNLMPNWTDKDFETMTLEKIQPYLVGYVSFVRVLDTGVIKVNEGIAIPSNTFIANPLTRIVPAWMSEFQYKAYLQSETFTEAVQLSDKLLIIGDGETEKKESFFKAERDASNFVFPDGSYGTTGFNRYIEKNDKTYTIKNNEDGKNLKKMITGLATLSKLSAKYAKIIEICQKAYPNNAMRITENQGIMFIFFFEAVEGSGAIMLAKCLEENGYEEFVNTESIFRSSKNEVKTLSVCGSSEDSIIENRQIMISKRPRFAILSSKTTADTQIKVLFDTLNSYENRYGEYLQILIGSRTAKEGININNGIGVIKASSSWNTSVNYQSEMRIFRSNSLAWRIDEKRKALLLKGEVVEDVTFEAKVYNMASVWGGSPTLVERTDLIDMQMYILAEQKDREISKIFRFIKQCSIDCFSHYARNVRNTDVDGSAVCEYQKCKYTCVGIKPETLTMKDKTTKILYYSDRNIVGAKDKIIDLFSINVALTIEQINLMLPEINHIYILMALEQLISNNTRILNRLGVFSYLREDTYGMIYLETDSYSIDTTLANAYYSAVILKEKDQTKDVFSEYVNKLTIQSEEILIQQIFNTPKMSIEKFNKIIDDLSIEAQVFLLETVIKNNLSSGFGVLIPKEVTDRILERYNNVIYKLKESTAEIERAEMNIGRKKGRSVFKPIDDSGNTNDVYLHSLYTLSSKVKLKEKRILRILKAGENEIWRDTTPVETQIYNQKIDEIEKTIQNYYNKFEIYGILIPPDKIFKLRDKLSENIDKSRKDTRFSTISGKVCTSWHKPELVDILYRLGVRHSAKHLNSYTNAQIIGYLKQKNIDHLNKFDRDKLEQYYIWFTQDLKIDGLCDLIQKELEKRNMIYDGSTATRNLPLEINEKGNQSPTLSPIGVDLSGQNNLSPMLTPRSDL